MHIAFFCVDDDGGGWGNVYYDEETDTDIEYDLAKLVSSHLKDEHVAVFMESGHEKLRYIAGYAEAINNKGVRKSISLVDIYNMARTLGSEVTEAEY